MATAWPVCRISTVVVLSLIHKPNSFRAQDWCFLKSQQWTGCDSVRYDPAMSLGDDPPSICNTEDFNVDIINPALQTVTGLYSSTLLCDECFLKIWRQRLTSPFLIGRNWIDYRISALNAMQKNCLTTMVYSTSAATLLVGTQDPTKIPTPTSRIPPRTTGIAVKPTCTSQTIQPPVEAVWLWRYRGYLPCCHWRRYRGHQR
jgi:hypothetical protein